jgi:hypothetical protein
MVWYVLPCRRFLEQEVRAKKKKVSKKKDNNDGDSSSHITQRGVKNVSLLRLVAPLMKISVVKLATSFSGVGRSPFLLVSSRRSFATGMTPETQTLVEQLAGRDTKDRIRSIFFYDGGCGV